MVRNPFNYPASSESWWKNMLANISGYEPKTTFFSDLSIAECFGAKSVEDTYNKVIKEWGTNIVYITEFVMCLNHKIWQLHELDVEMAKLYDSLWKKGCMYVETHFNGNDLSYYYEITD